MPLHFGVGGDCGGGAGPGGGGGVGVDIKGEEDEEGGCGESENEGTEEEEGLHFGGFRCGICEVVDMMSMLRELGRD